MDNQKDKFPQDEDKNQTDNSLIEKEEEITDADTSTESERKNDSEKTMLTPDQISKEYSKDDQKSEETKEKSLHIPSEYKEICDEVSTSNLDTFLQISAENSAMQSNPILTGDTEAELQSGLENKSSENTSSDHQEINKECGLKKEDSSNPSEEIVFNRSRIQKSTAKTPHMRSPSPSTPSFAEISLRIISPRRSRSLRRNSGAIIISDESPALSPRSTAPQFIASFFSPTRSTAENSNSVLQNATSQGASAVSPLHLGNLSAHNFPNLEQSPTGISFNRTPSFIEPLHYRNFCDRPSVNRPMWSPPNDYLPYSFTNNHLFPPNCSYYVPTHPIVPPSNCETCHGFFVPSIFEPPFSEYDSNASCPTMEHSSSISSTRSVFTTQNLSSTNTLTSSHCDSRSTSGFLTNPTTCFPPSRAPYSSFDPVSSSADFSKLVDSATVSSTGVSSMPVSSANELLAPGTSSVCPDISGNSERPSQEPVSYLLRQLREHFTRNPVRVYESECCPERRRRISVASNLRRLLREETAGLPLFRESSSTHGETVDTVLHQNNSEAKNSDEQGGLLTILPSPAAEEPQISQRVPIPKRAREESGCSSSRYSDDGGRFINSRSSRSSSMSSDCSRCSYKFRDEEDDLHVACERLAEAGISEVEFRRYAKAMFEWPAKLPENYSDDLRSKFRDVFIKLGTVQLARLYNQLNKSVVGTTEHERRLNAELVTILELGSSEPRRVSDRPPRRKSAKLSSPSRHQRTSSDETVRDPDFTSTLSTSREESIISLRKVKISNKSVQVDITTKPSSSAHISIAARLDPQSINNRLMASTEMQTNDSSDPVPNEHSSEQMGSIDNANAEETQMSESEAEFDNGSRIDTSNDESENEETGQACRVNCNVM